MVCVPNGEPDFPKIVWKYKYRGLVPALKFIVNNKQETLKAISRGACLIYSFLHCLHNYHYLFNEVQEYDKGRYYLKALISHAVTSTSRLCFKITHISFEKKYLAMLFFEDSFQQLLFTIMFMSDYYFSGCPTYGIGTIVLSPILICSLLHFSGYLLSLFYVFGFQWRPAITLLTLLVGQKAFKVAALIDFLELILFVPVIFYSTISMAVEVTCTDYKYFCKYSEDSVKYLKVLCDFFCANIFENHFNFEYTRISMLSYISYVFLRCKSENNQFGRSMRDCFYSITIDKMKSIYLHFKLAMHFWYDQFLLCIHRRIPEVDV